LDALLRVVNFLALEQSNCVVFSKFDISIVSSSNAYHLSQLKYLRSVRRVISVDVVKPSLPDQGVASSAEAVAVGVILRLPTVSMGTECCVSYRRVVQGNVGNQLSVW